MRGSLCVNHSAAFAVLLRIFTTAFGSIGAGWEPLLWLSALLSMTIGNFAALTQNSLHESIAFVPQEPILFHRSLMENIRFSRPGATDEEVIRAAKLAHCHEFISSFPAGYQTLVGERGVKLSGGERQRVAIARAILMNAPILVLDEATSSLDSESETYIQDSLSKLVIGRTVIAVAHRLSTIQGADLICVVDRGHIVDSGRHAELIARNGLYARLYSMQFAEQRDMPTAAAVALAVL